MPQVIPAVVAAFATVKAAVVAIGAVKVLGLTLATWGKVAMFASMGAAMLLMKPPSLPSSGQQTGIQLAGAKSPLPIVFGRTSVAPIITYREAYPDAVHNSDKNYKLCFDSVLSVGPIQAVHSYKIDGHQINFNSNPLRTGSATGVSVCTSVSGFKPASRIYKDGVRAAYLLGERNDQRSLRDITGDIHLPSIGSGNQWGMAGLAHVVNVFEKDGSKHYRFPNNFPAGIQYEITGVKAYDPRFDSTYPTGSGPQRFNDKSTWVWSENPYICGLAFLIGDTGTVSNETAWGVGLDIDDIDLPAFIHGANVADANNWKVGGRVTTDDSPDAILSQLLACGGGTYLTGDKISVFVNEPKISTFTLTQEMLVGDQIIRPTRSMLSRVNRIVVSYREPNQNYEIVAGDEVFSAEYLAEDGVARTTETTYPLVQNRTQAHQLAAYELVSTREFEVDLNVKAVALGLERGQKITLDFDLAGIDQRDFIVKTWGFDAASQTVKLTLISETDEKHAFALGRTHVAPLPQPLKSFDALDPDAPDGWAIVDNKFTKPLSAADIEAGYLIGTTVPALVVAGEVADPNVREVQFAYREAGKFTDPDAGWTVSATAQGDVTNHAITSVVGGTPYEVSITYRTTMNVISPRLVLTATTAGQIVDGVKDGGIKWDDDTIAGRPPVITDLDPNNNIRIQYVSMVDGTSLEDAMTDVQVEASTALDEARDARQNISNVATGLISTSLQLSDEATRRETDDEAMSSSLSLLGEKNATGTAFVLGRDTVLVNDTQTLAQRESLIEARFDGSSSSYLLNKAETAASEASAAASALTSMGVDLDNAGAFLLDSSKVKVSEGEALSSRLTSIGANLINKLTQTQVDARVDSKISASITESGVIASHLQSSYTSKNDFNSTAGFLSSSIDGVASRASMFVDNNGRIGGVNIGATQTRIDLEFMFDRVLFVDVASGNKTKVLDYIGGQWTFDSNVHITGDLIVDGTIKNKQIEQNTITGLSAAYQASQINLDGTTPVTVAEVWTMLEKEGSPVLIDTNAWLNLQHDAGGSFTTYIDVRRSKDTGLGEQILLHQLDGSGMANDIFAGMVPFKLIDRPTSAGNWRYFVRVWSSVSNFSAQQCRARFISALEFKTNT